MIVKDLIEKTNWVVLTKDIGLDNIIDGVFCGDLLSFVIGNSNSGNIWVTMQGHINAIGVACLKDLSAIILVKGAIIDDSTIDKAIKEGVVIINSGLSCYNSCKVLIELGL